MLNAYCRREAPVARFQRQSNLSANPAPERRYRSFLGLSGGIRDVTSVADRRS